MCKNNFAVAIFDDQYIHYCKEYDLLWFFAYPLKTFTQLYRSVVLGASDAYISDELCHNLDIVEEYYDELTIRVIANNIGYRPLTDNKYLNGSNGDWFRPEDLWELD